MIDAKSVSALVNCDPEIMGGTPVFRGTRVPVQTLFDYLGGGDNLDVFLDDFPTVPRDQAIAVLEASGEALVSHLMPRS